MKILRVNLEQKEAIFAECPQEIEQLSGRALISRLMLEEVDPACDPLGPRNKLIFASGILGGTTVSCVNRISIGAKSPLTGGIKESNGGGTTGYKLARLKIKALVLEGVPRDGQWRVLFVSGEKAQLVPAGELQGMGVYETAEKLKERYGHKVGLVIIGPAGERLYRASGIANNDMDGVPSRYSGRGGLGAVMGSKKIKAIVIDDSKSEGPDIADAELFKKTRKEITKTIMENELIANTFTKYGTARMVMVVNSLGALPTRNFSTGAFEGAENISGQKMYELITTRQGEGNPSHACMPGCLIRCSNVYPDETGKALVSPLEFETIGLMGSNCGIDSLDAIARMNYICNDLGLDTIDTGGAIGVAMEAGILGFGDAEGALNLLEEVRKDTFLGKIIASGTAIAGQVLGVKRIPACKGQGFPAYDPRAIKGLGVTYATSPMGADHTAGHTIRTQIEHARPEGQVEASRNAQISYTVHDCIGTCYFLEGAIKGKMELLADLAQAMTGRTCSVEEMKTIAQETLLREILFNEGAGFHPAGNKLPEFCYLEENPAVKTVFDVPQEEMDGIFNFERE